MTFRRQGYVIPMAARRKNGPRKFYLREWRKFMGTKAVEVADAIGVERESYYRLERETYRLSLTQIDAAATCIGVEPNQFWFHPPSPGADRGIDLNALIAGQTPETQAMIVKAIRGMVEK